MEGTEETGNGHDKSLATATEILDDNDVITSTFKWRGKFYRVRAWPGKLGERVAKIAQDQTDARNKMAVYAQTSLVDENNELIFTDKDLPALSDKPVPWLMRVQKEVLDINGLTPEAQAKLGEVSAPTPGGASHSS